MTDPLARAAIVAIASAIQRNAVARAPLALEMTKVLEMVEEEKVAGAPATERAIARLQAWRDGGSWSDDGYTAGNANFARDVKLLLAAHSRRATQVTPEMVERFILHMLNVKGVAGRFGDDRGPGFIEGEFYEDDIRSALRAAALSAPARSLAEMAEAALDARYGAGQWQHTAEANTMRATEMHTLRAALGSGEEQT